MINYLGHGGMDRLAAEGLLTTTDIQALVNNRTPVVNALTCVTNRYEIAGYDSLGEEMVLRNGGGAVAMWAPSGLSHHAGAVELNTTLLQAIYESGSVVLGEAIVSALRKYATLDGVDYMAKVYVLLGDPATMIRPGSINSGSKRNPKPPKIENNGIP